MQHDLKQKILDLKNFSAHGAWPLGITIDLNPTITFKLMLAPQAVHA